MLAQFSALTKRYLRWLHRKTQRITNCTQLQQPRKTSGQNAWTHNYVQTVTDGISWRVTSGRENTSLILVDHRVKVIEGCYHNVMLL